MKLRNPFAKKKLLLSVGQKKFASTRAVKKAKKNAKKKCEKLQANEYHRIYRKLIEIRKARMAMTHLKILNFSERKKVLTLAGELSNKIFETEAKYADLELESIIEHEHAVFEKKINLVLGKNQDLF